MTSIRVLPNHVIDRIAAGEVIERPASVVKELVENSFDAGARMVQVDLNAGGLERIVVSDDGSGMSRDDLELCIGRHATSKIRDADDLFAIRTLGFRGEALSSISAVSRTTITSRRATDEAGWRLCIEGGELLGVEQVGCPVGTTLDVRDLFYNTPARRKFMRSPATEQSHATDAVLRTVLGARRGGAVLMAGGRRLLDIPEETDGARRVVAALGKRVGEAYPFSGETDGVRVSGFVTRPEIDRANARGIYFFINGRYVRDRMLQRALLDGYRSMVERGRYPVAVVYVDVDPAVVDVNVHPQKLEVRFSDGNSVFRSVSSAIAAVLGRTPWVDGEGGHGARTMHALRRFWSDHDASVVAGHASRPQVYAVGRGAAAGVAEAANLDVSPGGYFAGLRPVGQVLGLYLVCEGQGELVLIDQHAAHERVTFERLRQQAEGSGIERQALLFPDALEVAPKLLPLLEERWESLRSFGFEVEPTGPDRYAVRAIPAELSGAQATRLVSDLLEELGEVGAGVPAEEARARVLSRCACHASVRAGDRLGPEEIRALLEALDRVDFGANCPHGRPVYQRMSRGELDRLFHR